MKYKISVILPTNRKNSKEQLDIIHKVADTVNEYESNDSITFDNDFTNLTATYAKDCTHILKPTLLSLVNQSMNWLDYEIILCHRYPEDMEEAIKCFETRMNIKLIKEPPSIWHELGNNYTTVNNIRNSGIINAEGELLIFLDDLSIFNHHLLQDIWEAYKDGYLSTAKAIRRIRWEEKPEYSKGLSKETLINGNIRGAINFTNVPIGTTISTAATWTYCTSAPLDEVLDINGFDEIYDGSFGGTDQDFGRRLAKVTKYRRKIVGMIYEFASLPRGSIRIRNDEILREICNQSPNPVHVGANTWKPTKRDLKRYENYHKNTIGELDPNWNKLMDVPLIDLKEERKKIGKI